MEMGKYASIMAELLCMYRKSMWLALTHIFPYSDMNQTYTTAIYSIQEKLAPYLKKYKQESFRLEL